MRMFVGFLIILIGFFIGVASYYYAWVSGTPDYSKDVYEFNQSISMVLGIAALIIIFSGVFYLVKAIKKINAEYRESSEKSSTKNH